MTSESIAPFTAGQTVALQIGGRGQAKRRMIKVISNNENHCLCSDRHMYDRRTGKCLSPLRQYRAIHTPHYGEAKKL